MGKFLASWLATFVAVLVTAWLLPGLLQFPDVPTAAVFALVLAVLNASVRPVLLFLTLPLSCLTLGLFTLVVNAAVFWLAAVMVPGITIGGFLQVMIAALIVSVISTLVGLFVR